MGLFEHISVSSAICKGSASMECQQPHNGPSDMSTWNYKGQMWFRCTSWFKVLL
jgi:hypothetical protein